MNEKKCSTVLVFFLLKLSTTINGCYKIEISDANIWSYKNHWLIQRHARFQCYTGFPRDKKAWGSPKP